MMICAQFGTLLPCMASDAPRECHCYCGTDIPYGTYDGKTVILFMEHMIVQGMSLKLFWENGMSVSEQNQSQEAELKNRNMLQ